MLRQAVVICLSIVTLAICVSHAASDVTCRHGYFIDVTGKCHACSHCPVNQIIRHPCTPYRDNVCGPFHEFTSFRHGPRSRGQPEVVVTSHWEKQSPGNQHVNVTTNNTALIHPSRRSPPRLWHRLWFGLLTALFLISLTAAIYVIVTQLRARSRLRQHKLRNTDNSRDTRYAARMLTVDDSRHAPTPSPKTIVIHVRHYPSERHDTRCRHTRWISRLFGVRKKHDGDSESTLSLVEAEAAIQLDTISVSSTQPEPEVDDLNSDT